MKITKLFIMLLVSLVFLTSCQKEQIVICNSDNYQVFVDEYYKYQIGEKSDYVAIDLRTLDEYGEGHFKGFINYNLSNGSKDELKEYIEGMYDKSIMIFLIDGDNNQTVDIANFLYDLDYHHIYVYTDHYSALASVATDSLFIVTGTDDCGC